MDNGPCPYLPDRRWVTHGFFARRVPESRYEELLAGGWRRSGTSFYRNQCPGCTECTPLRVPVDTITPTKSQRRVLRKNADLAVTMEPAAFDEPTFDLYSRYHAHQHDREEPVSRRRYRRFLIESPVDTRIMRYFDGRHLVGAGWVDVLADGLSSVYFAFAPEAARRSLGTFSIFEEAAVARELGKRFLYLGFYVAAAPKMAYKNRFGPNQRSRRGQWTDTD